MYAWFSTGKVAKVMGPELKMMARHRREMIGQQNLTSSSSDDDTDQVPTVRRKPIVRKKTSPQKRGMTLALTSGVFAAFAGTFGKLAMNQDETVSICEHISNSHLNFSTHDALMMCEKASIYIRIVAFVTMILLNTIMWTTFVKALRYCSTSLEATITNTAANFLSSAIVGQFVFDEAVSLMWGFGTVLIICGLLLMNYGGVKNGAELRERRKRFKNR